MKITAKNDNQEFNFFAGFYQLNEIPNRIFRKYAYVARSGHKNYIPDLTIVMLNPGSCKSIQDNIPLSNSIFEVKSVPVKPDATMHRVKAVLKLDSSISCIQILNLSDYCQHESENFFTEQLTLPEAQSIFHSSRKDDLSNFIKFNAPILLACGVDSRSFDLLLQAKTAIQSLGGRILNSKSKPYHPLARRTETVPNWIDQVKEYLDSNHDNTSQYHSGGLGNES